MKDKEIQIEKINHSWGSVLAMSLCAMALVGSEFMPVSLLTPIAIFTCKKYK